MLYERRKVRELIKSNTADNTTESTEKDCGCNSNHRRNKWRKTRAVVSEDDSFSFDTSRSYNAAQLDNYYSTNDTQVGDWLR